MVHALKVAITPKSCSHIPENLESSRQGVQPVRWLQIQMPFPVCSGSLRMLIGFFYFFFFPFTVTLITARSMYRGWHSALLAAWAPQKCAETLQERWKSSSKHPTPILGRRYIRELLNTLLWIKTQDWLDALWISGILDGFDHTGWIFSQFARQRSKLLVCL